jgi:hypothetical protein
MKEVSRKRNAPKGKEGGRGVKKTGSERREMSTKKSVHINRLNSSFPSLHLAGRWLLFLSLSSFYIHPRARIRPRVRVYACVCEGGVKREREERRSGRGGWIVSRKIREGMERVGMNIAVQNLEVL